MNTATNMNIELNGRQIKIADASTKDLVKWYNENADKPVKRFSTRMVAESRVLKLAEELTEEPKMVQPAEDKRALEMYNAIVCPHCQAHVSNGVLVHGVDEEIGEDGISTGHPLKLKEREFCCLACGEEFGPKIKAADEKRSMGVAKSWLDPKVVKKRAQRSAVEVDGETYKSVRQAYIALGLDLKDHIAFRMHLKEVGSTTVDGRSWKIIPLNY